ncbi:MAG: hypothetical protein SRB2_00074 [Desulfobacteraceae bacterium Eth-SRB2]|nr:MAG: hypothetical protein SRB2_00074 [Desulfobacteraceae bacterium Eth-SRB2]
MISDIPTYDDFADQGTAFLNLAWDTVLDLLLDYEDAEAEEGIIDDEQPEEYWKAAIKPLATAVALVHQGAEFHLKARIALISPYLLITSKASEWPRKSDKQDTSFSSFYIADAQNLIKIHDTVAEPRLSDTIKQLYEKLRLARNKIFHTVDKRLRFSEKEIIQAILEISDELISPQKWTLIRRSYLESIPRSFVWTVHPVGSVLSREMMVVLDLLGAADAKKFFGFNKRQRKYICPNCVSEHRELNIDENPLTAQLSPNKPNSTNLFCFVCRENIPVIRKRCKNIDCKGNVIHEGRDFECLTCFIDHEADEIR